MGSGSIWSELANLFYPNVCVVCGDALLTKEEGACLRCLYALPKTGNYLEKDNFAEVFLAGRFPFERIASFCLYTKGGKLPPLIHQLKYYGKKGIGIKLGRLFGFDLKDSEFLQSIDLIVPVPLHPKKERQRGYNQAEMIAQGLSQVTSIPVNTGNLNRVLYNPTQTKRTKTQRWENVKGIFEVAHPALFAHKHVLLVDDVLTTGSTIEACGVALQACRGIKISVATLGQVP